MLPALRTAGAAGLDAGAELRARERFIRASETRNDPCSGEADIGAIVAIPDALHHRGHVFFAQTRVRAGVARFETRVTGGDALDRDHMVR